MTFWWEQFLKWGKPSLVKPWEDGALIYLQDKRKLARVSTGYFGNRYQRPGDSLVAQTTKYLPVMQETWVRSLSWEDPLEEGMAGNPLQYSCLENLHVQRSLVGYSPWGRKKSDMTEQLSMDQRLYHIHLIWSSVHLYDLSWRRLQSGAQIQKTVYCNTIWNELKVL